MFRSTVRCAELRSDKSPPQSAGGRDNQGKFSEYLGRQRALPFWYVREGRRAGFDRHYKEYNLFA